MNSGQEGQKKTKGEKWRKIEMYREDSYNCLDKASRKTTISQSWNTGKLEARKEEEVL